MLQIQPITSPPTGGARGAGGHLNRDYHAAMMGSASESSLAELLGREFAPEAAPQKDPIVDVLLERITASSERAYAKYECDVFNFLCSSREVLRIRTVEKFRNLLVDGAIDLVTGERIAIEVKFRMNWEKACQAEWQFRNFLKREEAQARPVTSGIVFFEEFSADWARGAASRTRENGWNFWYGGHCVVEKLRLDLVRFRNGYLEPCPEAASVLAGS